MVAVPGLFFSEVKFTVWLPDKLPTGMVMLKFVSLSFPGPESARVTLTGETRIVS